MKKKMESGFQKKYGMFNSRYLFSGPEKYLKIKSTDTFVDLRIALSSVT